MGNHQVDWLASSSQVCKYLHRNFNAGVSPDADRTRYTLRCLPAQLAARKLRVIIRPTVRIAVRRTQSRLPGRTRRHTIQRVAVPAVVATAAAAGPALLLLPKQILRKEDALRPGGRHAVLSEADVSPGSLLHGPVWMRPCDRCPSSHRCLPRRRRAVVVVEVHTCGGVLCSDPGSGASCQVQSWACQGAPAMGRRCRVRRLIAAFTTEDHARGLPE